MIFSPSLNQEKSSESSNFCCLSQWQWQLFAALSLLLVGQRGDWRGFSPNQFCSVPDFYLLRPEGGLTAKLNSSYHVTWRRYLPGLHTLKPLRFILQFLYSNHQNYRAKGFVNDVQSTTRILLKI